MNLDTLLHESATVDDAPPSTLRAGRATMDTAIIAAQRRQLAAVRSTRRRRSRRLRQGALIGAAAAFAIFVIPVLGGPGVRAPISTASAEEVLIRAGAAAGEQPAVSGDAAYWHSVFTYTDVRGGVSDARREMWIGRLTPSVLVDTASNPTPMSLGAGIFGPGIDWDEMDALPTDPVALEAAVRHYSAADDPASVTDKTLWGSVMELLTASPASPALRQSLWMVVAKIPGATLGEPATDSTGRAGITVAYENDHYLVDPDTGRVLERLSIASPGDVVYRATYLEQGPADTAPAAP